MTNKQIIIDGVDVSGCPYYIDSDGSCSSHDCECIKCIHNVCFYKDYKAKEQECEELKNKIEFMEGYIKTVEKARNEVEQQLDQAKVDKDELEKEIRQKKMTILMNNDHYFEVGQTNKKLKQALQEIKEICNNNAELQGNFNVVDCDKYKLGKHRLSNKILQKISEVENEN